MKRFDNCIGLENIATNGQKMVIIAYVNSKNLDVQFEDGTIVRHKTLTAFKSGQIRNPNAPCYGGDKVSDNRVFKRVGLTNIATNGQKMTIIAYRNANDIDVQFEDGTIVCNKSMRSFLRGEIRNPNKISKPERDYDRLREYNNQVIQDKKLYYEGMQVMQRDGMATCLTYRSNSDIDIRFNDSDDIINTRTSLFVNGKVPKPENKKLFGEEYLKSLMGRKFTNSSGKTFKIVGGKDRNNLIVQFEDGIKVKGVRSTRALKGEVMYPGERAYARMTYDANKRIGERYYTTIGMGFTVSGFEIIDNQIFYILDLDDGIQCKSSDGGSFRKGEFKHPNIKKAKCKTLNMDFHDFKVYSREFSEGGKGGKKYYSCSCNKCGVERIMTFDEMLSHTCELSEVI